MQKWQRRVTVSLLKRDMFLSFCNQSGWIVYYLVSLGPPSSPGGGVTFLLWCLALTTPVCRRWPDRNSGVLSLHECSHAFTKSQRDFKANISCNKLRSSVHEAEFNLLILLVLT